jgi:uncharacterized phage-associated protein
MAYPAAAIANELLVLAEESNRKLTQIDIQKLVYFAHGWHLGLSGKPLIQEPIEAWKYGPVVKRLYDAFKRFGSSPITEKAMEWHMTPGGRFSSSVPCIEGMSDQDDTYARSMTKTIWNKYGMLQPFKLVEITHLPDSPWAKAFAEQKAVIPNEEIASYFKNLSAIPNG